MIKVKETKRCRVCDAVFKPFKSTDTCCSLECSIIHKNNGKTSKKTQRKPISKNSVKRKKENTKYLKDKTEFLNEPENKICPVTGESTTEVHHQKGRIGELLLNKYFWLAVSRKGHDKIENNPKWAKENAFSYDRLEVEIWFPLFGYDGFYECSTFGKIRSLDRVVETKKGVLKNHVGQILSQTLKKEGYLSVMVSVSDEKKRFNSHRILLQSFTGEIGDGLVVNHKNFKRNQNHINNLEWMTEKENNDHAIIRRPKGELCSNSKLTDQKVLAIRRLYRMNPNFNKLALSRKLKVQDSAIHKIINNQRWKHLNDDFPILSTHYQI